MAKNNKAKSETLEDLFILEFIPSDSRPQPCQFPLPVDFPVDVLDHSMPMSLVLDSLPIQSRIPLMRCSQLMVSNNFLIRYLEPFRGANVMLGVDKGVADEANV